MEQWKRTLAVTATSQVLSILGFNFVVPFLPLYIQHLGIHGTASITLWAALLSGGAAISMAVAAPIWGVLSDRHGRKIMVVRATLSAAIIIGLMGLAQNVYQLLLLRLLQGAFTGTVSASQALVASQVPRDRLGSSLGVMQTALYVGSSMGPFAGGIVADAVGFRASFLVSACSLLVAGALVAALVKEQKPTTEQQRAQSGDMWAGMKDSLRTPALVPMIAAYFGVNFGTTIVFPILPQFVQSLPGGAGHAASLSGLMFAGAGVAGAAVSISAGYLSDRVGFKRILAGASLAAAAFSIPQFFVTSVWQLLVLRVLVGGALGAVMPAASALIASLVPPRQRGTAYGLAGSANSIGFGAGPLTAAAVVEVSGMRSVFLAAGAVLGGIALWTSLMVRVPNVQPELASNVPATEHARVSEPTPRPAVVPHDRG